MRLLFSIVIILRISALSGQITFKDESFSLNLLDQLTFDDPVCIDESNTSSDPEFVQVFKNYFKPADFESYKSFFLPEDWGGFTKDEFNDWQARIDSSELCLFQVLHVQQSTGQEFFIGQYVLETEAYRIPQSVKFKKVNGSWKHIHVRNDILFPLLHKVGSLQPDVIIKYANAATITLDVSNLPGDQFSVAEEKFSRDEVFERLRTVLQTIELNGPEIDIASQLFKAKDDQSFIEFISEHSSIDYIHLMEEFNTIAGFQLFNYTKTSKE